jgi:hypothetical protein
MKWPLFHAAHLTEDARTGSARWIFLSSLA